MLKLDSAGHIENHRSRVSRMLLLILFTCGLLRGTVHGNAAFECLSVLLEEEFRTPCAALNVTIHRPCLVNNQSDVDALRTSGVSALWEN